jgi:hypothetical protein
MTSAELDNLARIGKLRREPTSRLPDEAPLEASEVGADLSDVTGTAGKEAGVE